MANCTDPNAGVFLHAYELGALSEQDSQRFELHLITCEYCFDQVSQLREILSLVANDVDIRSLVSEAARLLPPPESAIGNLWTSLWLRILNKDAGAARLAISEYVQAHQCESYKVMIETENGATVYRNLSFNDNDWTQAGALNLTLRDLRPGAYRLFVSAQTDNTPPGQLEYLFQVK